MIFPSPDSDPFAAIFEKAGYTLTYDAKGRYYAGMWKLMGSSPDGASLLREEYFIRLFSNAQIRKGRAFTYRELLAIAQPGSADNVSRFIDQVYRLIDRQILLRGYNLKCPVCDLDTWYDLANVSGNGGLCQGCRSEIPLPLELPFAYRLNQLFIAGLKNGALTVLLTVLLLSARDRLTWRAGCQIRKGSSKIDIDLAVLKDGTLILAECKDNFSLKEPDLTQLTAHLNRDLHAASDAGADQFLFVTLRDSLPEAVIRFLDTARDIYGGLEVRAITRSELLSID